MNVIVYYLSLRYSERKLDRELEREGGRLGPEGKHESVERKTGSGKRSSKGRTGELQNKFEKT